MKDKIQSILPLALGLIIGAVASTLIQRTLAPAAGTPEEQVAKLEHELKQVRRELNAITDTTKRKRFGATTHDGVRGIAMRVKEGLPVTPDDIFNAFKPLMRDLSPLTERMSVIEASRRGESLAGEYARKYGLDAKQQKELIEHIEANELEKAQAMTALIESDSSSMRDFMKLERESRYESGIDAFMSRALRGENLKAYQIERTNEKAQRVQQDADLYVKRVDDIVKLDQKQRHQMFLYMAQTSSDYEPQMQFDDLMEGTQNLPSGMERNEAMMSVLRQDQRAAYQAYRQEQLAKSQQEAARMGITLPNDWHPDDDSW